MTALQQSSVTLNDGVSMPQLGLGVWQTPPEQAASVVANAVAAGYKAVDTAAGYDNEEGVGEALVGHADVFLTTKLRNDDQGYDQTLKAFDASAKEAQAGKGRPLPRPLAVAVAQPLSRELEGPGPTEG